MYNINLDVTFNHDGKTISEACGINSEEHIKNVTQFEEEVVNAVKTSRTTPSQSSEQVLGLLEKNPKVLIHILSVYLNNLMEEAQKIEMKKMMGSISTGKDDCQCSRCKARRANETKENKETNPNRPDRPSKASKVSMSDLLRSSDLSEQIINELDENMDFKAKDTTMSKEESEYYVNKVDDSNDNSGDNSSDGGSDD